MSFNFKNFELEKDKIVQYMNNEMQSFSTGCSRPQILDMVQLEIYGSRMPVSHLASINIEDARTLRVSPYDKKIISDLEKVINLANLGVSVTSDSDGLRLYFPAMTTESRHKLVKVIKEKLEEARVKVRGLREDNKKEIEKLGRSGEFGKDEMERLLEELQNNVDLANKELEQIYLRKEGDIFGEE